LSFGKRPLRFLYRKNRKSQATELNGGKQG